MKTILKILAIVFLTVHSIAAEEIVISHVSQLLNPSDLVARVTIIAVATTRNQEGVPKLAKGNVVEALKGTSSKNIIEIESDCANACPTVCYEKGETVLIFLQKMKNGHYVTVGKYLIENEMIWKSPFYKYSYNKARAVIKKEMVKQNKDTK